MTAPGATAIDVAMALRSVRKLRGLTLRQASSRLGVSESNWSRIERGCVPLNFAALYGKPLDWFATRGRRS